MLHDILRFSFTGAQFLKPVAITRANTVLKSRSENIKKGATVTTVIKFAFKPTLSAVLGATVDQVVSNLQMRDNYDAALIHNPHIVVLEIFKAVSDR